MRHIRTSLMVLAALVLLVSGCARSYAPNYWLPSEAKSQQTAFGGWAHVEWGHGKIAEGELIAISADSIFVLSEVSLTGLQLADVSKVRVASFESGASWLAFWTTLGSISTGSHGVALIISLPVWLIAGSAATAGQSRVPLTTLDAPLLEWKALRPYARFPQGMPAGLDRSQLVPKTFR